MLRLLAWATSIDYFDRITGLCGLTGWNAAGRIAAANSTSFHLSFVFNPVDPRNPVILSLAENRRSAIFGDRSLCLANSTRLISPGRCLAGCCVCMYVALPSGRIASWNRCESQSRHRYPAPAPDKSYGWRDDVEGQAGDSILAVGRVAPPTRVSSGSLANLRIRSLRLMASLQSPCRRLHSRTGG